MHRPPRTPAHGKDWPPRPSLASEALAVASGGVLGATLRHALSRATLATGLDASVATLGANLAGAWLLGALLARYASPTSHPLLRPFWVVGVCGSFTTFSTLAAENRLLAIVRGEPVAWLHLAGSIALGIAAFALGQRAGEPRP
jgi:CrcB protein